MAEVRILRYPTDVDWERCKQLAISTMWKTTVVNQPDDLWKAEMLFARHSPIRTIPFTIQCWPVKTWVATHFVRHKHLEPYVSSQRNDRQDMYDRDKAPQDAPVIMTLDLAAEELMTLANKRLCSKAHPETQALTREICDAVIKVAPEFERFAVPFCVEYGCHEMRPCQLFEERFAEHVARIRGRARGLLVDDLCTMKKKGLL